MCLRGDITANSTLVGEWYAQRLDDLTGEDDWHDYLCEYVNHNEAFEGRFTRAVISHRYSDGAAVLASLVLQLAEGGWDKDPEPVDTAWLDAGYAPETTLAMVTKQVQVAGDTAYLPNGQVITGIHPATACEGRGCPLHHPSTHLMASWPLLWRGDRGLMERTCPHGIGHPDVDHMAWYASTHNHDDTWAEGVHGCDRCCVRH